MPRFQLNGYQRLTWGSLDIRRLDIHPSKSGTDHQARLGSCCIALMVHAGCRSRIYKRAIRAHYRKLGAGFLPSCAQMIYFISALYFSSSDLKFCRSIAVLTALSPVRLCSVLPHCLEPREVISVLPHCLEPREVISVLPHCPEPREVISALPHCFEPREVISVLPHCLEPREVIFCASPSDVQAPLRGARDQYSVVASRYPRKLRHAQNLFTTLFLLIRAQRSYLELSRSMHLQVEWVIHTLDVNTEIKLKLLFLT